MLNKGARWLRDLLLSLHCFPIFFKMLLSPILAISCSILQLDLLSPNTNINANANTNTNKTQIQIFQSYRVPICSWSDLRQQRERGKLQHWHRLTSKMILLIISVMWCDHCDGDDGGEEAACWKSGQLSLLLAKFFALLAIFLCQLLFPNKQHLHRF